MQNAPILFAALGGIMLSSCASSSAPSFGHSQGRTDGCAAAMGTGTLKVVAHIDTIRDPGAQREITIEQGNLRYHFGSASDFLNTGAIRLDGGTMRCWDNNGISEFEVVHTGASTTSGLGQCSVTLEGKGQVLESAFFEEGSADFICGNATYTGHYIIHALKD